MRRISLAIAAAVFISTLFMTVTTLPDHAMGTTHYVGGGGPGNHSSIQQAIDNASGGDTIFIYSGTYYEHILANKSVSLLGENRNTVTVDGGGLGVVVNVSSDQVNITSIGVTNGGSSFGDAGIALYHVRNCNLTDLRVVANDWYGVLVYDSYSVRVVDSTMSYNRYGALIWSSNQTNVSGSSIIGNDWQGLYVFESFDVTVTNNTVSDNTGGGITLYASNDSVIKGNSAIGNRCGVSLLLSNNSSVTGNILSWNDEGVALDSTSLVLLEGNTIQQNLVGISLEFSVNVRVANNTMLADGLYVEGESIEHWNSHVVEASNTVNGKPLLYWINRTGGIVDFPVGQVILANCTGVVVRNQTISNVYAGVELGFSSGTILTNSSFQLIGWIGILAYKSDYTSISDGILTSGGWVGIRLDNSNSTTLESVVVSDKRYGIEVQDCVDTMISESDVYSTTHGISLSHAEHSAVVNSTVIANEYGISLAESHFNLLANLDVSNSGYGISVSSSDRNELVGNVIRSSLTVGISLQFSMGNTVHDNEISNGTDALALFECSSNVLTDNLLRDNMGGLSLNRSDTNEIDGNTIRLNDGDGIHLNRSRWNNITNNMIDTNEKNGLLMNDRSSWNAIEGNTIRLNAENGVHLIDSSSNRIANNTIDTNGKNGLLFQSSDANIIARNEVYENPEGIGVYDSLGNSIYHNNFSFNTIQAVDDGFSSDWDNGYPIGGNYWSDYVGNDSYSGPAQNISGSDGIGDDPYIIDVDSIDRYPLVHPHGSMYPGAPTNVRASLVGLDLSDVRIEWDHSTSGGPVSIYEIYKSDIYCHDGSNYMLFDSVSNWSQSYLNHLAGEGNPNNYFYMVCAVNFLGLRSCSSDQASKFTRPLSPGPNLVSVPLIQSNESIETVLQTVEFDYAWDYDSSSQEWKRYMKSKTYERGLWSTAHTDGMWANVTQDCNLTVAGTVPPQITMHLYKRWNLVPFPSFNTSYSVSDLKAEVGATRVEGYDPAPPYFLRVLGDADVLQAGYAYWVRVDSAAEWIVEVS